MAELTREVLVKAEPSTIYALLIEPGRQSWLGTEVEFDPRPGGLYKIKVGGDHPALGEFVVVKPNEKVAFTFGWDEPGHPDSGRIDHGRHHPHSRRRGDASSIGAQRPARTTPSAITKRVGSTSWIDWPLWPPAANSPTDRLLCTVSRTPCDSLTKDEMSANHTWTMIHDERARAADMLEALSPEQWTADTLCGGWNVRQVAAHMMIASEQTTGHFLAGMIGSGFRFDTMTQRDVGRASVLPPGDIIARIRARTTTTNKPPAPAMAMLGEVVVHGTDIRQPLTIDDDTSLDAKLACLNMFKNSNFPVPAKKTIEGLRLRATDADWSHGSGPEVSGPTLALLMAMVARPLFASLSGDGVETLRSRITK